MSCGVRGRGRGASGQVRQRPSLEASQEGPRLAGAVCCLTRTWRTQPRMKPRSSLFRLIFPIQSCPLTHLLSQTHILPKRAQLDRNRSCLYSRTRQYPFQLPRRYELHLQVEYAGFSSMELCGKAAAWAAPKPRPADPVWGCERRPRGSR